MITQPTNQLTIQYPSELLWACQMEPEEFAAEAKQTLALALYHSGKLSTGLAAKVAGMPRSAFIILLGQHGLSPFGADPAELETDLAHARAASRPQ
ncbi:MAG: UPF0175 family protein [Caldilineaceae bacterium]|nr:UPF0175 family protein [Caldilineaceae bacterium]